MQVVYRYGVSVFVVILLTFVWVFHGFASVSLPDSLAVSASFVLLLLPGGILAHWILNEDEWSWSRFIAFGLPISIGLVGLISLPVRTLNLSMSHIALALCILSVVGVIWATRRYKAFGFLAYSKTDRLVWILAGVAIAIVLSFALLSPYTMRKNNDILLHSAEITYYASNTPLGWDEIYFDTGNPVWARVSLAVWRLAQGAITWTSDVHVFLSQLTVSAMLILYMGVAVYVGARLFDFSIRHSLMIVIIHFAIFTLLLDGQQAGGSITTRIIRDKILAGYAFTPVVLGLCRYIIQTPTWRAYLLFAFVLIGSIFTHPILTGFMLAVMGIWMVFNILLSRRLRPFLILILLSGVIFSPIFVIRFTTEQEFNFGEEKIEPDARIWLDEETQLYAINPEIVGVISYFILIVGAVTSVIQFRKDEFARFYLAMIVVISLALIPYTAWIYGSLVSVDHINRALWILTHGMMLWYLVTHWSDYIVRFLPFDWKPNYSVSLYILISGFALLHMLPFINDTITTRVEISDADVAFQRELIAVGDYIETQTDTPVIVTGFNDYIRAMSHVMKPVNFCNRRCMIAFTNISDDEARLRHNFGHRFFNASEGHTNQRRIRDLNNYNVEYILFESSNEILQALFAEYPDNFELVFQTDSVNVIRYTPSESAT